MNNKFSLVIHGGAGVITKSAITPDEDTAYREALKLSLQTGYKPSQTRSYLDAVIGSVKVLEDSPLFNAGRGSVFTKDGIIEMEATIMDGKTLKAVAVTGIKTIKTPLKQHIWS